MCRTNYIANVLGVLEMQVYINTSNVDDYLVESISKPATDPNAGEVYYRYIHKKVRRRKKYIGE